MVDFQKYPDGKDTDSREGMEISGNYYPNLDLIIALAKALVKKGVLTKAEIITEL